MLSGLIERCLKQHFDSAISRLSPHTTPNNGMHPTADTAALIFGCRSGRRVMPGVRRLLANHEDESLRVESREERKRLRLASGAWLDSLVAVRVAGR
jgi:hypothetical protein